MKKVLSILVALSIICSLAFVPMFAEAAAGDVVTFDFENESGNVVGKTTLTDTTESTLTVKAGDSASKIFRYIQRQTTLSGTASITYSGSVTLNQTGYYKVTYILGRKTSTNSNTSCNVTVNFSDEGSNVYEFNNSRTSSYAEDLSSEYKISSYCAATRYESELWFEAGNVDFSFDVQPYSTNKYRYILGTEVKFEYIENPTLKFAEFDLTEGHKFDKVNGPNGDYLRNTKSAYDSTGTVELTKNIKIAKTGWYNVKYLVNCAASETVAYSSCKLTLTLTDVENEENVITIGGNERADRYVIDNTGYTNSLDLTGAVTTFNSFIEIPEGDYTLKVTAAKQGSRAQLDYITFNYVGADASNKIETAPGEVTVTGTYDPEVSGTAILALYKGEELVHAEVVDVTDSAGEILVTTETTVAFDKAKLLVWENKTSMLPQAAAIAFAN